MKSQQHTGKSEKAEFFFGKVADPKVTGQLIDDSERRGQWLALVRALQLASETLGGPLEGWLFHGSSGDAIASIESWGLVKTYASVMNNAGKWIETEGVHFGSANVAAFFAEDRIESLGDPSVELAIFGAPLNSLRSLGTLATDANMVDIPLYSRLRTPEDAVNSTLILGLRRWEDCLQHLETVVVLGDVPIEHLHCFRTAEDVQDFVEANVGRSDAHRAGQKIQRERQRA